MVDHKGMMSTMEGTLPHHYPFRMIDRVVELEPGQRAVAVKEVSFDDFFLEHTLILIIVDCGHEQQRNDRSGADDQNKILAQEVVAVRPFPVVGKVL